MEFLPSYSAAVCGATYRLMTSSPTCIIPSRDHINTWPRNQLRHVTILWRRPPPRLRAQRCERVSPSYSALVCGASYRFHLCQFGRTGLKALFRPREWGTCLTIKLNPKRCYLLKYFCHGKIFAIKNTLATSRTACLIRFVSLVTYLGEFYFRVQPINCCYGRHFVNQVLECK